MEPVPGALSGADLSRRAGPTLLEVLTQPPSPAQQALCRELFGRPGLLPWVVGSTEQNAIAAMQILTGPLPPEIQATGAEKIAHPGWLPNVLDSRDPVNIALAACGAARWLSSPLKEEVLSQLLTPEHLELIRSSGDPSAWHGSNPTVMSGWPQRQLHPLDRPVALPVEGAAREAWRKAVNRAMTDPGFTWDRTQPCRVNERRRTGGLVAPPGWRNKAVALGPGRTGFPPPVAAAGLAPAAADVPRPAKRQCLAAPLAAPAAPGAWLRDADYCQRVADTARRVLEGMGGSPFSPGVGDAPVGGRSLTQRSSRGGRRDPAPRVHSH